MELVARVNVTANSIGLPLDTMLSYVRTKRDGSVTVVATTDAFPRTEDARSVAQSALHAALLEDLADIRDLNVRVFVPPCVDDVIDVAPRGSSNWRADESDVVVKSCMQLALASYNFIIHVYPWVDVSGMRARIPDAMRDTKSRLSSDRLDKLVQQGINLIIPPIGSVVTDLEYQIVLYDVVAVLGVTPTTLFMFYVALRTVRSAANVSDMTLTVHDRLFCCRR